MMDGRNVNWRALFDALHPGFFERPSIRRIPAGRTYEEMALWLADFSLDAVNIPVPEGVTFGCWTGDIGALRRQVARVDGTWPELFREDTRVYCACDGGMLASFCMLEDMGEYNGLRVAGPGCVGTLPEYRRRGIGLKMVQNATAILKAEGYDLGYIHYTGVAPWYARLGYGTVLRWNGEGITEQKK